MKKQATEFIVTIVHNPDEITPDEIEILLMRILKTHLENYDEISGRCSTGQSQRR